MSLLATVPRSKALTTGLVYVARIIERMDEQLLPSVYFYVGCSFHATPSQLGTITLCRALVQALGSPVGGILGHVYNRAYVISAGCAIWAVFTAGFAMCTSIHQGMLVWAFNGMGLAWMIPNGQSLIADLYDSTHRGTAFGALLCTGALGSMLGSLYATNVAGVRVLGLEGWRFAFLTVAAFSALLAVAIALFVDDPRCPDRCLRAPRHLAIAVRTPATTPVPRQLGVTLSAKGDGFEAVPQRDAWDEEALQQEVDSRLGARADQVLGTQLAHDPLAAPSALRAMLPREDEQAALLGQLEQRLQTKTGVLREVWDDMRHVIAIPSFLIIIAQGIIGTTPWNALVFFTLYLQLLGMTDAQAGALYATFLIGDAAGALLGGWIGDRAGRRWPDHGRVAVCQFSVGIGVPLSWLLLKGLPTDTAPPTLALYAALLLTTGVLVAWPAPACNNPVFAEIVPDKLRSLVYAFDRSFEGAISALGAPLVGVLAERVFHFRGTVATHGCEVAHQKGESRRDLGKAKALGSALTVFLVVPWTFATLVFSFLHCTYPRDRRRAEAQQAALEQAALVGVAAGRGGGDGGGPRRREVALAGMGSGHSGGLR